MVSIPQDYFIVEVDNIWEVTEKKKIITLNEAHIHERAKDGEWESPSYKRVYGTVISVPVGYSDQKVDPISYGAPEPKIFIGHDLIQERVSEGFKDWGPRNYHPSLLDNYEFRTLAHIGALVDVKVGERVYFNPVVTEPENLIGISEKSGLPHFKIRVDSIIGAGDPVRSQGGWQWVRPDKETWEEITSAGGIVMKSTPGYKPLRGTVVAGVARGERVLFQTNSEWPLQVNGETLYCMEEENVMCAV